MNIFESGDKHHKPNPNQYGNIMAAQNILKVIFMEHAYICSTYCCLLFFQTSVTSNRIVFMNGTKYFVFYFDELTANSDDIYYL